MGKNYALLDTVGLTKKPKSLGPKELRSLTKEATVEKVGDAANLKLTLFKEQCTICTLINRYQP